MRTSGANTAALGLVVLGLLALGAHGAGSYGERLFIGADTTYSQERIALAPNEVNGWEGLLFSRKLDANFATEEDWRALPFVGKRTAKAIVQTRERLGGFERYEQFLQVSGIGPKRFEKLRSWVEIRTAQTR